MSEGFPLLTTKKMAWKQIVTELLWFLRGDTNIKYLVDNDCHIWDGDAYKSYENKYYKGEAFGYKKLNDSGYSPDLKLSQEEFINRIKTDDEFAKKWGELGPVYGKQWRSWNGKVSKYRDSLDKKGIEFGYSKIDQISNLINDLKTNPYSRRLMVNAWNVGELDSMVLPPCHYGFQVYTRELSWEERYEYMYNTNVRADDGLRPPLTPEMLEEYNIPTRAISLMYNARSQDVPLGTPFNIASYALLLEIIAKMVNMVPDELITNMGDCHIYKNQIDGIIEQLTREPYPLPKLVISEDVNFTGTIDEFLNSCSISEFKIQGYQSHPTIKIPLSN